MANQMPYLRFEQAIQQLSNIVAIDYFFAKEFSRVIPAKGQENLWCHLLIALSAAARQGHTCLPLSKVANQAFGIAYDESGLLSHQGFHFPDLETLKTLVLSLELTKADKGVVYYQNSLYMRRNFNFEQELQTALIAKKEQVLPHQTSEIKSVIHTLFPTANGEPTELDWQQIAVANSVNKGLSIIAGGPGTGKTYTVTKLLAALVMLNNNSNPKPLDIALVAPTGKAAQRLSESITHAVAGFSGVIDSQTLSAIPTDAQTLHRLLGVIPNQVNFRKGKDNLLDYDVIIIDEVSMVDLALMARLFRAIPSHCQVIMLGDADQLPSVALGSVLADIAIRPHLGYSSVNTAYLNQVCELTSAEQAGLPTLSEHTQPSADHLAMLLKSRRFDGEGAIGNIAMATINGQGEQSWQYIVKESQQRDDLFLLPELSDDKSGWLASYINQYYQPLLTANSPLQAFELLSKFRLLCATRVGSEGVEAINQQVIAQLKGNYYADNYQEKLFHGMPIMINENHYGLGLYNGDIGVIWQNQQGHLLACFETSDSSNQQFDGMRTIIPSRLPSFEPVFAMTIHKTQGSEFEHVAMVLPSKADNQLLTRELIYTGVTRAKKCLSLSTNKSVWLTGVNAQVQRYSNLAI